MKIQKLLTVVLLMAISFNVLHAFTISFLDEDHCSVSEYVQEIEQASEHDLKGDICDIHHNFHLLYILPESSTIATHQQIITTEPSRAERYASQLQDTIIKPPIALI